jgi:hypothetical protein
MKSRIAALLVGLAFSAPALADATAAFHDGKWPAAIAQGRAEATTASLTLAGRAQLAVAAYQTTDKALALALVQRAEADFDAALAKSPGDVSAQVQKAVAIGYRAKLTEAPGLAKDSRSRFEAVRAAHPDNALAWSAIGGWHGGAIATLGSFLAGTMLGAKSGEVDRNFSQALKLEPNSAALRAIYAIALLDLDKDNGAKAAVVLNGIAAMPARDGFEALLRAQGVQLAAAIKVGNAKAAQATARRLQAFGTLS